MSDKYTRTPQERDAAITRYTRVNAWARKRYQDARGYVTTMYGQNPSRYTMIEEMAARRYLLISPGKRTMGHSIWGARA